jgi:mono/diheme cytochrome c family protein
MTQHHSDILPEFTTDPRPPKFGKPKFWMISIGLIAVVGSWLPLVLFARAWASISPVPRVQFLQDMGIQPKYREQQTSDLFADGRADRPRILGTVARGQLHDDDSFYAGYTMGIGADGKPAATFFETFPKQVKVTEALVHRGQQRFNIYCSVCHGLDGQGHGAVNERAVELQAQGDAKWAPAFDLTSEPVKKRAVGHIFNTINVGIRSMPAYGAQIPPADRWAIVAYVRSLQQASSVPAAELSQELKDKLNKIKKQ